jgi:hypothetical protein
MLIDKFCSPDKPPIEELQYFLDFQVPIVWAPAPPGIAGHTRKEPVCPSLQFSLIGQKLFISTEQVKLTLRSKHLSVVIPCSSIYTRKINSIALTLPDLVLID